MDRPYIPDTCDGCPSKIVCRCLNVTEAEVVQHITRLELRTIRELRYHTGAGEGCTCCHAQLEEYLEKLGCVHEMVS
jgi:bacterioferritin-associated ferredoxin